jgi:RNA polymerase sigma-70 factor (ECF subfamily)
MSTEGTRSEAPDELHDHRDRRAIERIASGDADAFAELFDRYGPQSLGLAVRLTGSRSVAEEVVQEVFASVWRKAGTYDPGRASVRAWLLMQVHHRAVDTVRHEEALRRRTSAPIQAPQPPPAPEDVVEDAWLAHRRARVRVALAHLSVEHTEVLNLAYFSGMTQTQIADKTGIPLGTVKTRTLAAMRRLRALLDEGASP